MQNTTFQTFPEDNLEYPRCIFIYMYLAGKLSHSLSYPIIITPLFYRTVHRISKITKKVSELKFQSNNTKKIYPRSQVTKHRTKLYIPLYRHQLKMFIIKIKN